MNVPVICVCCMSVLLHFGIRYVVCNILFDCVHKIIFLKMPKKNVCIYRYCVLSKSIAFLDCVPFSSITLLFEFSKSSKLSLHNGVVDTPFFYWFCNFEIKM